MTLPGRHDGTTLPTVVRGKVIVLQEPLAREFDIQPVGPHYSFSDRDGEAHRFASLRDRREVCR